MRVIGADVKDMEGMHGADVKDMHVSSALKLSCWHGRGRVLWCVNVLTCAWNCFHWYTRSVALTVASVGREYITMAS